MVLVDFSARSFAASSGPDRLDLVLRGRRRSRCVVDAPTSRPSAGPRRRPAARIRRSASSRGMPRASRRSRRSSRGASTTITASYSKAALRLDEQRHVVDDDPVGGRGRDLAQELLADRRMRDRLEVLLRVVGRRTPSASAARSSVPSAWRISAPNRSTSFVERRRPRLDHLPRDESASTTTAPRVRQHRGNRRLPRPDPARQPHHQHAPRHYRHPALPTELQPRVWSAKANGTRARSRRAWGRRPRTHVLECARRRRSASAPNVDVSPDS